MLQSRVQYNRMKTTSPTPDAILQTAFGFWNSKVLLTAVTFDLFTTLGQRRLTGAEIGKKLDLHPRGVADFLDALVVMKLLSIPSSISNDLTDRLLFKESSLL